MAEPTKKCPECGSPMKLDKRPKFEGQNASFTGEDYWICTNPRSVSTFWSASDDRIAEIQT